MTARASDLLGLIRTEGWSDRVKKGYDELTAAERADLKRAMELPLFS